MPFVYVLVYGVGNVLLNYLNLLWYVSLYFRVLKLDVSVGSSS